MTREEGTKFSFFNSTLWLLRCHILEAKITNIFSVIEIGDRRGILCFRDGRSWVLGYKIKCDEVLFHFFSFFSPSLASCVVKISGKMLQGAKLPEFYLRHSQVFTVFDTSRVWKKYVWCVSRGYFLSSSVRDNRNIATKMYDRVSCVWNYIDIDTMRKRR